MAPKSQIVANIAVGLLSLPTIPYSLGGETVFHMKPYRFQRVENGALAKDDHVETNDAAEITNLQP
ncbi:hypothetical protein FACS1894184_03200 [Clostridia bacterium]|nr:hypothetical protein FACS1894184_03200 [Clostridia bacterium]